MACRLPFSPSRKASQASNLDISSGSNRNIWLNIWLNIWCFMPPNLIWPIGVWAKTYKLRIGHGKVEKSPWILLIVEVPLGLSVNCSTSMLVIFSTPQRFHVPPLPISLYPKQRMDGPVDTAQGGRTLDALKSRTNVTRCCCCCCCCCCRCSCFCCRCCCCSCFGFKQKSPAELLDLLVTHVPPPAHLLCQGLCHRHFLWPQAQRENSSSLRKLATDQFNQISTWKNYICLMRVAKKKIYIYIYNEIKTINSCVVNLIQFSFGYCSPASPTWHRCRYMGFQQGLPMHGQNF